MTEKILDQINQHIKLIFSLIIAPFFVFCAAVTRYFYQENFPYEWHGYLSWFVNIGIISGLIAALSGLFTFFFNRKASTIAKKSRQDCLRIFSFGTKYLPWIILSSVIFFSISLSCVGIVEATLVSKKKVVSDFLLISIGIGAYFLYGTIVRLKSIKCLFQVFRPTSFDVVGRVLLEKNSPALWAYIRSLAASIGSIVPDHIVLGVDRGFFVISHPIRLLPENRVITGNTLYLAMPYLGILSEAEVTSVIAHELGHFYGEDTEYSKHFSAVYQSIAHRLGVIFNSGKGGISHSQALSIGKDFLTQFAFVESHWSRIRELEADNISAKMTDSRNAAIALLRHIAAENRIVEVLNHAAEFPDNAPRNLMDPILNACHAKGFDNPMQHIETRIPHPIDTHPTISERIKNWNVSINQFLLADATRPLATKEKQPLNYLLGEQATKVCELVSSDWLSIHKNQRSELNQHLAKLANKVDGTRSFYQSYKFSLFFAIVAIIFVAGLFSLAAFSYIKNMMVDMPDHASSVGNGFLHIMFVMLVFLAVLGFLRVPMLLARRFPTVEVNTNDVSFYGLDQAIAWCNVQHISFLIRTTYGSPSTVTVTMVLFPNARLPKETKYWLRISQYLKINRKKHQVRITLGVLEKYKFEDFCNQLHDFWVAAQARNKLNEWQQKNWELKKEKIRT